MKQYRGILVLAGVLVVLAGCYAGLKEYNHHQEKAEEEQAEAQKVYLVKTKGLTSVSYTDGTSEMEFLKEDGTWYYEKDREVPMDEEKIEQITGTLSALSAVRELQKPDDLSDYGLDAPAYTVTYVTEDGEEGTVEIGSMTGENYYAKTEASDAVYTITDDLVYNLSFELSEFVANDTVPSISSGNLTKVTVTEGGTTTEYKEDDDITELAGGWGTLSLTDLADCHVTEDTLQNYGLENGGQIQATAAYKDQSTGKKKEFTVHIGSADADGVNRYVMVDGSVLVYKVSSDIVDNMITVDDSTDAEE